MATASGRVNTPTTSTSASANGKNFSSLASPSLSRTSSCITTCTTSAPSSSSSSSSPPANYIHYCHKIDLTSAKVKGHNCYFCTLFVYLTIILTIQTTTALANTSTSSNSNSNSNNNNSNHASSDGGGVKGLSLPKSVVANSLVPIIIEKEKDEVSSVDVKERTSSITDAAGERRGEESPSLSFLPSVGGGKLLWPSGTLKEKADEGSQLNSGHSNCLSSEQGSHLQAKLQQQQGQRQELRLNSPTIHDDRHQHSHPHHLSTASHPLDSTPITRMDPASASSSNQKTIPTTVVTDHEMDTQVHSHHVMQTRNHFSIASTSIVSSVNNNYNSNNYNYNYNGNSNHNHNGIGNNNNNNNNNNGGNLLDLPSRPQIDWSNENYRPIFEPSPGDRNVTAQLGKSTFLRCRIRQITDETVSWVRQRDLHIISAGEFVYTSDLRFKPKHTDNTDDWYLHIEYVQKEDAGVYECQVSSEPRMSLSFILNVIEATSSIVEGPSASVKVGSSVKLTCVINQTASPPLFIYWYKNQKVIDYGGSAESGSVLASGGRMSVSTEKGPTTVSILRITEVTPEDAGNYSCTPIPTYADSANVTLNVLNGENPAAISRNQRNPLTSNAVSIILMNLLLQPFNKWIGIRI